MQKNDFLCVNNIIFQIYNMPDFYAMRLRVLALVQSIVPFTFGSFMIAGKGENGEAILCDPVCLPEDIDAEQVYMNMQEQDYGRWMLFANKSMTSRASDLIAETQRVQTPYYKLCYEPYGLHYSVDSIIVNNGIFLGILTLYRERSLGDFTEEEMFVLQALTDHLSVRFDTERLKNPTSFSLSALKKRLFDYARKYRLTNRECEVLELLLTGKDPVEIAERLCISDNTLKKHQQNLYRKFDVSGRMELLTTCHLDDSPEE